MKFHILYNNETIIPNISQNIRKWPVSYDIDNAEAVTSTGQSLIKFTKDKEIAFHHLEDNSNKSHLKYST